MFESYSSKQNKERIDDLKMKGEEVTPFVTRDKRSK
jgi:hypothetical protein